MAINQLYISDLNPLHFVPKTPVVFPQYNSRDYQDFPFDQRIQLWQEHTFYKQKWQTSDTMFFQFESNFAQIQLDLFNMNYPNAMVSVVAGNVAANPKMPGWYVYEASISYAGLEEGCYFVQLSPGNNAADIQVSEPIELKILHDGTIYYEYKNSRFHGDIVFETGIQFSFRVEGFKGRIIPASDDVFYKDQKLNPSQLSSKPYRPFPLSMGGSFGIPDWVMNKINWIWSCDSVLIDGKSYTKDVGSNNSSTQMQINEQEDYPLYGITMQIAEGINRASKIIAPTLDTTKKLVVAYQIDGTLYGDLSVNVGDNLIPINAIE